MTTNSIHFSFFGISFLEFYVAFKFMMHKELLKESMLLNDEGAIKFTLQLVAGIKSKWLVKQQVFSFNPINKNILCQPLSIILE